MTTLDGDPGLNNLVWDGVKASVENLVGEYDAFLAELRPKAEQSLKSLFACFFAKHDIVESLAFSLTQEEYDDSTYGGYDFLGPRVRFDLLKMTEEEVAWVETQGRDYSEYFIGEYIAPSACPDRISATLRSLAEMAVFISESLFARLVWGPDGVFVTRDKIAYFYSSEQLTDLVRGQK